MLEFVSKQGYQSVNQIPITAEEAVLLFENTKLPLCSKELLKILSQDQNSISLKKLESVIQKNTPLVVRIMKMANSPLYGFPQRIESLSHAIVLLGLEAIKGLTILYLYGSSHNLSLAKKRLVHKINRHLIKAAKILTDEIIPNTQFDKTAIRAARTGVLIHDIGKFVLVSLISDNEVSYWLSLKEEEWLEEEAKRFEITHTIVGQYLAEKWQLPASLTSVIAYHHTPENAPESYRETVKAVQMANKLANRMTYV